MRTAGRADGRPLGVLGVVFNWESLAQTIVKRTLLSDEEKPHTRVCIVDESGLVLADSQDRILQEKLELPDRRGLFALVKGHRVCELRNHRTVIAHARSPGFEMYRTGWHSVIVQTVSGMRHQPPQAMDLV